MGHLHVFFFPFMAHGHMIPALDIAKLFAARGVKSTIITTPLNASCFLRSIQSCNNPSSQISVRTVKFPAAEVGFPENCENADQIPSPEMVPLFMKASTLMKQPLEELLRECQPDCLVADAFFPWATGVAAEFGIPRLVFHGVSFFSLCASKSLSLYKPQLTVSSDDEAFVVPNLPHEIKLTRTQMLEEGKENEDNEFSEFLKQVKESETKSYGVLFNSFYELEPKYADHYRNVLGVKCWHIGPVSLCNREIEDKAVRGKEVSINKHECLKWLDSKEPNSVIYVCFGSIAKCTNSQLFELAMGLEASEQNFIWVVRRATNGDGDEEKWLPEGFEERTRDRGLIIRGWAPQVLILDHEAVGGFVTHCGWNSILEGVCAGLPLVTWPAFAEQFLNEKLVTEVLRIGVGVGALKWSGTIDGIKREAIEKAVRKVMVGEEADEMRKRAMALKNDAKKAVEEGGSSYSDLNALLEQLGAYRIVL